MNETRTSTGSSRSWRRWRIFLILSLALNLLLIGVMVGGVMRVAHRVPALATQADMRSLWRALPAEARADLRATARERGFPGDRPPHQALEARRERVARMNAGLIALLRSEPFDAEGFFQVLDGEREAVAQRMGAANAAFVARVAELSAGDRAAMAAALERAWADRLPPR